jgi:sulfite reductase beta subunit-like hemoprotein
VAHIGGNYEGGEIVYGARLKVRLPAKRVPEAVERWIRAYEDEREDGEVFNAYAERVGTKEFEDKVRDLAMPVEFGLDTMNHFIDWNRNVPFQVIRGEGECAV